MTAVTTIAFVVEVIDGDTFKASRGEYVRLANVCAPEKGQAGWVQARDRLARLVLKRVVTMAIVAHDIYGRPVAEVWSQGVHVNRIMRQWYPC